MKSRVVRIVLGLSVICGFAACDDDPARIARQDGFTVLEGSEIGMDFSNTLSPTAELNIIEYLYYYNGGGVAVGDIDGDGLEDVYLAGNQTADRLYRNLGTMRFTDISELSGIEQENTWSSGVSMADYDNDGDLDIYVCKVSLLDNRPSHNLLYINDGTGVFTEQAEQMGLDFSGFSTQAAPIDFDGDGDLDLYLLNHTVHSVQSYGTIKSRSVVDTLSGDLLFENRLNEDGRFHNVSQEMGIYSSPLGYGLAVCTADFNADGWVDIYVGNDFHENDYLYINQQGKGFKESIGKLTGHTSQFSMGVDVGDIDGDADLDFFTTDMMPYEAEVAMRSGGEDTDEVKRIKARLGYEPQQARNHLQLNNGAGYWGDHAYATRTFATDWSWSVLLEDFDHNGRTDIFISNGIVRRPNDLDYINYLSQGDGGGQEYDLLTEQMPSQPLHNILFHQTSSLRFTPVKESTVGRKGFSTGAAVADLDNDGDLDIITNNINAPVSILRNDQASGAYLQVELQPASGSEEHSHVTAYVGEKVYYRQVHSVRGFQSSSSTIVHFGLADAEKVDSLVIVWPDRTSQTVTSIEVNQRITVRQEADSVLDAVDKTEDASIEKLAFPHQDEDYYDEVVDKLMPERLSNDGPAVLVEDLNGDGWDDIYWGGGKGNPASLLVGQPDGSFEVVPQDAFQADRKYEDVAVASIDFDADGDRDLYVVSGGNEYQELDKMLEDRIYLNNGDNVFRRIPVSLPHTNGGAVAVADYDDDGYEDIFVGARSIPTAYGLVPYSFVLGNEKGRAVRIDYKERLGMITDAVWHDLDGDAAMELTVVGDWMSPRVFSRRAGSFVDVTDAMRIGYMPGLWNSVEVADINKDQKPDLILGNAGINHKWTADTSAPVQMYVGDFDGNGVSEPLIFAEYFGRYLPAAPLDQIKGNLPVIKKQFPTYEAFSTVSSLSDLNQGFDSLVVESKELTELRSMAILSSDSMFTVLPLPAALQYTDVQGLAVVDGDLYAVGNNKSYVAQFGTVNTSSAVVIEGFTEGSEIAQPLSLQQDLYPTSINRLSDGRLLIAVNNDYPYIVTPPNLKK